MAWASQKIDRYYTCNGELVKHYRTLLGLTQDQLAAKAGYTDRLVRKAEASQQLSADTIEVLAEALSSKATAVYPEDLVHSPREFALNFLDKLKAHRQQLVAGLQQSFDEEMSCFVAGSPERFPFAGEFQTVDGFDAFWHRFFSVFSLAANPVHNLRVMSEGNSAVLKFDIRLHHKAMDELAESWIIFFLQFRRGKVVRFEDYFDTERGARRFKKSA
ncbi:MAG: helix-turn-helix domain-containing protein [Pirellulales bacterium]|nr:helix-turn-helix domain-containing protein [Pirellulales bacterium]